MQKNLITNIGFDELARNGGFSSNGYNEIRLGTDSTAPTVADKKLGNQIGRHRDLYLYGKGFNHAEKYFAWYMSCLFKQGTLKDQKTGSLNNNVAEIGIYTSSNTIFSRALIRDENGNLSSINVLADEVLKVEWEFRLYYNPDYYAEGVLKLNGNAGDEYGYKIKPIHCPYYFANHLPALRLITTFFILPKVFLLLRHFIQLICTCWLKAYLIGFRIILLCNLRF